MTNELMTNELMTNELMTNGDAAPAAPADLPTADLPEATFLGAFSFHPGAVILTASIDVRDSEGNKIDELPQPPISLNHPHGEKLEQVLAVLVAGARRDFLAKLGQG